MPGIYTDYRATCEHGDNTIEFAEDTNNMGRKKSEIHAAAIKTAKAEMNCPFNLYVVVNGRSYLVFSNIK